MNSSSGMSLKNSFASSNGELTFRRDTSLFISAAKNQVFHDSRKSAKSLIQITTAASKTIIKKST